MTGTAHRSPAAAARGALDWLSGRRPRSPRADRALLAGAAVAFVVATVLAARALPDGVVELRWAPLVVLALLAVPAANVANAVEYVVAARMEGQRVPLAEAVEVSVLSSAANLLPLPGAALVRVRALRRRGATYRRAFSVTAVVGGAWLATSLLLAGALLLANRSDGTGAGVVAAVLVSGAAGVAASMLGVRALAGPVRARDVGAALLAAEVLAVAVGALRYVLVLTGLGIDVSLAQAVALTVAGVLASALGFVPGGLGVREALAGVIATVVGLPGAAGVLAAAVDRLVGLPVLAVLAGAVTVLGRPAPPPHPDPA